MTFPVNNTSNVSMRRLLVVVATSALVSACGDQKPPETDSAAGPAPMTQMRAPTAPDSAMAWTARPTKDYLTCTPQTVGPADALILRMERPHGSSLHIGGPDGTPYLVVFHGQGEQDRTARKSLMRPEAFAQLAELRVNVGTLTGGVWIFGRDTNEVVFRAPGTYRIRVGNDMETDGPDYAECLVTFRPK